ncbi:DUF6483 family protein [Anaerocolumna sp. AGMB13025]|uniref:DUF6483 family protein n=1 Tax=Anaerocolumna sp. AGMB13025 TaxID=3039116 RepID=UPI00241FE24C|nr:DUF6483 family protein [Anaerocolumna sp. AGMB13025]WFR57474.1 DUF6483 family protein [Anaerocolumna sp. AGMB13025]
MFEQDYIMRLIKEIIRVVLKLMFNIDTESPSAELLEDKKAQTELNNLLELIDSGYINEAENKLYDLTKEKSMQNLEVSLLFYSFLNDKSTEFLEEHGFSRDEVKLGIQQLSNKYDLGSMAQLFLFDL